MIAAQLGNCAGKLPFPMCNPDVKSPVRKIVQHQNSEQRSRPINTARITNRLYYEEGLVREMRRLNHLKGQMSAERSLEDLRSPLTYRVKPRRDSKEYAL